MLYITPLSLGTSGQISQYDFIQGLSNISNELEVIYMILTSLESSEGTDQKKDLKKSVLLSTSE